MAIVLDASAVVELSLETRLGALVAARIAQDELIAPHHIDLSK